MDTHKLLNGVDVNELLSRGTALQEQPELARFKFRVENRWMEGGHNRTVVKDFHAVGEEQHHRIAFELEADEPPLLLGKDEAPNPVEHLLNALVSCLTSSMVYHAALRGIRLEEVESTVEGEMDVRGFMNLDKSVRNGFEKIRVNFRVKTDAPPEVLEECARFSPVLDVVTGKTPVELRISTAKM